MTKAEQVRLTFARRVASTAHPDAVWSQALHTASRQTDDEGGRNATRPRNVHTSVVTNLLRAWAPLRSQNVRHEVRRFGASSRPSTFKMRAIVDRPTLRQR
jgi:hypothetical protein